jgi:hypothetical protein
VGWSVHEEGWRRLMLTVNVKHRQSRAEEVRSSVECSGSDVA